MRKINDTPMSKCLSIKVSEQEHEQLFDMAHKEKITVSTLIRRIVRRELEKE